MTPEPPLSPARKRALLEEAFRTSLAGCTVEAAVEEHVHLQGNLLSLAGETLDLRQHSEMLVIAIGKAGATLFDAVASRLPAQLPLRAVISASQRPERTGEGIAFFAGGHPQPNEASLAAASTALKMLKVASPDALVLFLVSGGASAMFELPVCPEILLEDIAALNRLLLGSGASITAINCVRKHLSAVKGGRLALAAGERTSRTLLVSDVPHNALDALGSGPTLPDLSSLDDFDNVLEQFQLKDRLPERIRRCVAAGLSETPKALPHRGSAPIVLLDNEAFLKRLAVTMRQQGYFVAIDNTCDDWDYQDAAHYLIEKAVALGKTHRRLCLLSGGEVTVRLPQHPGVGGRNQQFALYCATQSAMQTCELTVLSAGTDGMDGNSTAAGATADGTTLTRAAEAGLNAQQFLDVFDAGTFFLRLGDAMVTGPSGNNLRDARILLIEAQR